MLGNATQFADLLQGNYPNAKPALEVVLLVSQTQDPVKLDFNYTIKSVEGHNILVQIDFDIPEYVSSGLQFEDVQVTFWGGQFFKSKATGSHIISGSVLSAPVIRQVNDAGKTEGVTGALDQRLVTQHAPRPLPPRVGAALALGQILGDDDRLCPVLTPEACCDRRYLAGLHVVVELDTVELGM